MNSKARGVWVAVLVCLSVSLAAKAQVVPRVRTVSEKAFQHPNLFVPEVTEDLTMLPAPLVQRLRPTLASFGVAQESIFFDSRTGRPTSVILRQPMLPGSGRDNRLSWTAGKPLSDAALGDAAWRALRAYLVAHKTDLRLDPAELSDSPRIGVVENGAIIFIHVPRVVGGIPVRDNSIGAAINHGNLILLGMQKWGDVNVPAPALSAQAAKDAVATYVGPSSTLRTPREPHLEIVPMAANGTIDYRLAWVVTSKVDSDFGLWEALVDAGNGTLIAFKDMNQYGSTSGVISGGVYPLSNDQRPPDGVEQPNWPMSFVGYTINGVTQYTDVGGNVGCIPGSLSTALNGLYLKIKDDCGAVNETGTGGDRSRLGTHAGRDRLHDSRRPFRRRHQIGPLGLLRAQPPDREGAEPSRTGHARRRPGCASSSPRRRTRTTSATPSGTASRSTSSAPPSAQGCTNTGEIAAIFDHEWGHGVDNNGVDPSIANPGESIADMYAMLRLHVSCIGRGFFTDSTCGGYGDECVGTPQDGCTGVRDIDFANHRCDLPHTIRGFRTASRSQQCAGRSERLPGRRWPVRRRGALRGLVMAETGWDLQDP